MILKVRKFQLKNISNKCLHRIRAVDIIITYSTDTVLHHDRRKTNRKHYD